jgi:uncharacterized protein (TIGR02444 family)
MSPPAFKDNPFWRFSLSVYAAPGVAAECLALQERLRADVNILLFCAWLGWQRGITLSSDDLVSVSDAVGVWHRSAVLPLRSVRQFTRGMPGAEIVELRKRISADELEAERIEQAMLFGYAEARWPADTGGSNVAAARANLLAFIRSRGDLDAAGNSVAQIMAALSALRPADIAQ